VHFLSEAVKNLLAKINSKYGANLNKPGRQSNIIAAFLLWHFYLSNISANHHRFFIVVVGGGTAAGKSGDDWYQIKSGV